MHNHIEQKVLKAFVQWVQSYIVHSFSSLILNFTFFRKERIYFINLVIKKSMEFITIYQERDKRCHFFYEIC